MYKKFKNMLLVLIGVVLAMELTGCYVDADHHYHPWWHHHEHEER